MATIRQHVQRLGFRRAGIVRIVDSMEATALDLGLRGATAGLFLMMVVVIVVRVRPLDTIKWLGTAWTMPILSANPVLVWLWAQANFDDDFLVRRWHGVLWLARALSV